jgi:DNA-binding IclR family transcriptional regulator
MRVRTNEKTRVAPVPAIHRMVIMLEAIDGLGGVATVTQLADATDLAKSSVSNLLTSLSSAGLVRRTHVGWALGLRLIEFGHSSLDRLPVVSHFLPIVRSTSPLRHEYVRLAALDRADVLYLAERRGSETVRVSAAVGERASAYSTGKAMLAGLPSDLLDDRLAAVEARGGLPLRTNRSHATIEALSDDLRATAQRGFAIDLEESVVGVACLAVRVPGGASPCAVGVTLPSRRATNDVVHGLVSGLEAVASRLAVHAQ